MSNITKSDFLAGVKKSRVIDSDQFQKWLESCDSDNPVELAARLVKDQLLTKWQAKYLMTGRTRLDIGSYRLLERINRDQLGDRFLAIHIQLGRQVDIQVLPPDLANDKQLCDAFIQKASQTAHLDHPNLILVFDIDQESGRYFLVTEHVGGNSLDEIEQGTLTEVDVARLMNQAIAGILYAHENGVSHGDLTLRDLALTQDNMLKIRNLAVSPIRNSDTHSQRTDFQAIAEIATSLLELANPQSSANPELLSIFLTVATGTDEAVAQANQQLANWISENVDASPSLNPLGGGLERTTGSGPAVHQQSETLEQPEPDLDDGPEPRVGFIGRLADENPVALITTTIVIAIMLIGGTAWGAYSLATRNRGDDVATNPELSSKSLRPVADNQIETSTEQSTRPTNRNRNNKNNPKQKTAPKADEDGPLAKSSDAPHPNFDDPDSLAKLIDGAVPSGKTNPKNNGKNSPTVDSGQPTDNETNATQVAAGAGSDGSNSDSKNAVETPTASNPDSGGKDDALAANLSETEPAKSDTVPSTSSGPQPNATPSSDEASKGKVNPVNDAEPFKNFPRVTDLPPVENLEEQKIADLSIGNNLLMGAEIYADPAVCKTKVIFELERSADDKQKWMVGVKRRSNEKSTDIACFRRTESSFCFQWLPEAVNNKYSEFLRNCFVNLQLPEHAHWLALRGPIELNPLKLAAEQPFASLEQEIVGLPQLESIFIQVLPMKIPKVESSLDPAVIEFQQGLPARILLKKNDANAFVWIQVGADFSKSKLVAKSDLVLLVNGQPQPIKNLNILQDLISGLKQVELIAIADAAAAKSAKAPKGQGEQYDKIRSELDKAANLAKSQTAKAIEYVDLIPKFLDQPIEIRVNARMGQHTIELVKMGTSSNE